MRIRLVQSRDERQNIKDHNKQKFILSKKVILLNLLLIEYESPIKNLIFFLIK